MQSFKIKPNGFKEIRKKILIRSIPMLLISVAVGVAISTVNTKGEHTEVNTLPYFILLIAFALGFGIYRGIKRQRALFESYTLTITDNFITRTQLNTPTISVHLYEIHEIIRYKNGNLTIRGKEPTDLIIIPSQIDHYSELETYLNTLHAISTKDKTSFLEKYRILAGLLMGGLLLCVYLVNNKIIVATTGTILIALMVTSFIKALNNKNIDNKTKRGVWLYLVVIIAIAGVVIGKLTGLNNMG